jgi:hypothetical protein
MKTWRTRLTQQAKHTRARPVPECHGAATRSCRGSHRAAGGPLLGPLYTVQGSDGWGWRARTQRRSQRTGWYRSSGCKAKTTTCSRSPRATSERRERLELTLSVPATTACRSPIARCRTRCSTALKHCVASNLPHATSTYPAWLDITGRMQDGCRLSFAVLQSCSRMRGRCRLIRATRPARASMASASAPGGAADRTRASNAWA